MGDLRRVGVLWKPKAGAKSLGSGSLTIHGLKQRFIVLRNDRKAKPTDPDYVLLSSDEPEVDEYATRPSTQAQPAPPTPAPRSAPVTSELLTDDDIPF